VPFFFVFFCFCRFNKEKARKEIVTSPQKGKNWTLTHCSFLSLQIKERTLSINAVSVTKIETLLPLDPIVFTPITFRHTKRLPIRISRPSHKKFHFKNVVFNSFVWSIGLFWHSWAFKTQFTHELVK
jgi:hypothetical protein